MKPEFHILIVIGARPQIMKAAALANALKFFPQIQFEIIHSGQHYDRVMSQSFFEEFALKSPKYNLEIGSKSHNVFMAEFLVGFDEILSLENPNMVVVVGDTNTTAAAAIATAKRNIPLAHVEAGLREWDKKIPEEVNKIITDALSDLYFCPTQLGLDNLKSMGVIENVFLTGDITLDLLLDETRIKRKEQVLEEYNLPEKYFFLTCHRAANTDIRENLKSIVDAINAVNDPVIFPIHPRTRKALEAHKLAFGDHVRLMDPISYYASQALIKHAYCVLTDSGGIIKEAYFHKTPGIIIDTQTEWMETVEEGWNCIAGPNKEKITKAIESVRIPKKHTNSIGNGKSGVLIVEELYRYLSNESSIN